MANEKCEGGGKPGDLQYVEDLVMNRNVSSAHLINNSNGRLLNSNLFQTKNINYSTENIPRSLE